MLHILVAKMYNVSSESNWFKIVLFKINYSVICINNGLKHIWTNSAQSMKLCKNYFLIYFMGNIFFV